MDTKETNHNTEPDTVETPEQLSQNDPDTTGNEKPEDAASALPDVGQGETPENTKQLPGS